MPITLVNLKRGLGYLFLGIIFFLLSYFLFSKYSASIKGNLLFAKGSDSTFSWGWKDERSKEAVFNKQLIRLEIHLFDICISIGPNPFSRISNIPYDSMNDEFIVDTPDSHIRNSTNGQPGDSLFVCKMTSIYFFNHGEKFVLKHEVRVQKKKPLNLLNVLVTQLKLEQ